MSNYRSWWMLVCAGVLMRAAVAVEPSLPPPRPVPATAGDMSATPNLDDLLRITLESNPILRQAGLEIDAAQGRATQAGLYPNPSIAVNGDELNHRGAPGGLITAPLITAPLITAPLITQEIVTGGKLRLSRAVAQGSRPVIAGLDAERFVLFTVVRQGYFEVLTAQARLAILSKSGSGAPSVPLHLGERPLYMSTRWMPRCCLVCSTRGVSSPLPNTSLQGERK